MRRQSFTWTFLVIAIVLSLYGGYTIVFNTIQKKNIPLLGIIFFVLGMMMLLLCLILLIITLFQKRKYKNLHESYENEAIEDSEPEQTEELEIKKEVKEIVPEAPIPTQMNNKRDDVEYVKTRSTKTFNGGSGYVRKVGYGPVLRVENETILDMRTNTYYKIEDNIVKMVGSGPAFEIVGNKIRAMYGGYLYEISGSNINKIYGGFYASYSCNLIQTFDLKERYEISDSLNLKQLLTVVALLFEN